MDRLTHVIIHTGDLTGMTAHYQSLGLAVSAGSAGWVAFDTAGATLALVATTDPEARGLEIRFATESLDARLRGLAGRGVRCEPPGIQSSPWGRLAHLRDPEGRRLVLWQPAGPTPPGNGPALSLALNCRNMAAVRAFYRDALGFAVTMDSPGWVQLETGPGAMGLHPHADRPGAEGHHGRSVTIGLAIPDLAAWYEEPRARGVAFAAPPADRGYGSFADGVDPDGNALTFRDVPEAETLEARLAEPFEDDDAPARSAIRKPVKKRATAGSRLRLKPAHRGKKTPGARRHPARPAARDTKRARSKPAIGRLRKAERRTFKSKKRAVAGASKTKPVKRASRAPAKRAASRKRARP